MQIANSLFMIFIILKKPIYLLSNLIYDRNISRNHVYH